MTALRYLLAVPRGRLGDGLSLVSRPEDACGEGLSLWISDATQVLNGGVRGPWIIGTVFDRHHGDKVACIPENSQGKQMRCPEPLAQELIDRYWGGYLALIPARGDFHLFKSPLGHLPCYQATTSRHLLFASDPRLLLEAGLLTPAINWGALADHLRWPGLRAASTCLEGLMEICPGALLRVGDDPLTARRLWSPWRSWAERDTGRDTASAARSLRDVICRSVDAWTRQEDHVVVTASGGLDSSIVCAALAVNRRPFTCFTLSTSDPSGNEGPYVRQLGRRLGAPVIENIFDPSYIDLRASAARHLARPSRKTFMQQTDLAVRDVAATAGARLILNGNGGDHIFCYLHSSRPAEDRLRTEGLTAGTFRTLLDVSRLTQCSVATIARMVMVHWLGRGPAHSWRRDDRFLQDRGTGAATMPQALTPFLNEGLDQPPGKRAHVELLMSTQNNLDGYDPSSAVSALSPLMSQPIVEHCLSVPTWQWCEGGINRSLAREAFRGDLPRSVIDRVSKAGPDSFIVQMLVESRPLLRELLLDGWLVGQRIVDRSAVEHAIGDPATCINGGVYRLFDLVEAEAWVRSWIG